MGLAAQIQVQAGARAVIGDPGHLRVQGGQVLQSFGFRGQARQIERRTERQFGIAAGELQNLFVITPGFHVAPAHRREVAQA